MKYYKLIDNNQIIGAVSSNNFIYFSQIAQSFLRCDERKGEFVTFQGQLYHDMWMRPITISTAYNIVQAREISEEEYNLYISAIEKNEEIIQEITEEDAPIAEEPIPDPVDVASIEFIRSSKINEMSYACRKTIEAGFDLELRNELHHFSLDTQDQLNLISLGAMAQTQESIPYHADGEECKFYTAAEINAIVAAATAHKVYHTTYYNALKNYINALETIEEIGAITYGVEIPEEYQTDVLKALLNEANS